MTLLENEQFLVELTKFFQKCRLGDDGRTKPLPKNKPVHPPSKIEDLCLLRARLGSKHISTVIHSKEVNKFHLAYAAVLKANMVRLKKRERKNAGDGKMKSTVTNKPKKT
uniref:Signal recognition particle 14 kDa protein n=1 Tax=Syphacia muris TaxID=451379 RepID=A0A0N5AID6_9BILA